MNYDFNVSRAFGKTDKGKKWVAEQLAKGNKVVIASRQGVFCAKCEKLWKDCSGSCYDS